MSLGRVWLCNILQITIFTITSTNNATITATTTITTTITTTTAPQCRLAAYFLDLVIFLAFLGMFIFFVLWIQNVLLMIILHKFNQHKFVICILNCMYSLHARPTQNPHIFYL